MGADLRARIRAARRPNWFRSWPPLAGAARADDGLLRGKGRPGQIERSRFACVDGRRRCVGAAKFSFTIFPEGVIGETVFRAFGLTINRDSSVFIGQVEEAARGPDGERVGRVEGQEPDARFSLVFDIEAKIEFGEGGDPGEVWERAMHDASHSEGDDTDPGCPIKLLDCERRRDEGGEDARGNRPMREEEVAPGLPPSPWNFGKRPRSMRGFQERRMRSHAADSLSGSVRPSQCVRP